MIGPAEVAAEAAEAEEVAEAATTRTSQESVERDQLNPTTMMHLESNALLVIRQLAAPEVVMIALIRPEEARRDLNVENTSQEVANITIDPREVDLTVAAEVVDTPLVNSTMMISQEEADTMVSLEEA